ncbi:hypothetical protein COOONC_00395 [Cooperia oncophora]
MLAFEGGKYIILSMDTPFFYEGRDYYFDIYPRMRDDLILCSVSLNKLKQLSGKPVRAKREDPWSSSMTSPLTTISTPPTTMKPDEVLDSIQYRNGTQPQVITWACIRDVELCCGTDCCPEDDDVTVGNVLGWIVLIIIIGLVVIACCISLCHAEAPQGVQHDNPSPQVHGPDGHSQSYSKEGDPSTDKPPEGPPEGYQPERFPDRSLEKQKGAKTSKEGSISASKGASKLKESGQKLEEGVPGKRSRNQKKKRKVKKKLYTVVNLYKMTLKCIHLSSLYRKI